MGFLGDLGKGFVRSAVNQVGRDTGKVISNQIYGNAHSTPIRNVGLTDQGEYVYIDSGEPINVYELRNNAEQDGWKPNYSTYPITYNNAFGWVVKIMIWGILFFIGAALYPFTILIPVIPLVILINGIIKIFRKDVKWEKKVRGSVYVSDGRYKGGYRAESKEIIKSVNLPCNSKDKKINIIYGIIDIILAISLTYVAYNYGGFIQRDIEIRNCERIISEREQVIEDSIYDYNRLNDFYKDMGGTYYNDRLIELQKKYEGKYQEYIKAVNKLDSIKNLSNDEK